MTQIALFHSVLGVRSGIHDAADRFRAAGHEVRVVDQYGGLVFDDYDAAGAHVERLGFPALMAAAVAGVADLPDGFVAVGFSNGAGMAEHVATLRRCSGVVLFAGALPLAILGAEAWPAGVPVQLHAAEGDPLRNREWDDAFLADVTAAGASAEVFEYPGSGHLFTDPGLPEEFDPAATEAAWERVLRFCAELAAHPSAR